MKEYEYCIKVLEGYLCEQLAAVICMENYENVSYPHGYRHIFDEFRKMHEAYFTNNMETDSDLKEKSNQLLVSFTEAINETVADYDLINVKDLYLDKLANEEYQTLGKRIAIYPYLISEARKAL